MKLGLLLLIASFAFPLPGQKDARAACLEGTEGPAAISEAEPDLEAEGFVDLFNGRKGMFRWRDIRVQELNIIKDSE